MIYITGDTHGEYGRFSNRRMKKQGMELGESDYVIVCGDFGLCWSKDKTFDYNCKFFEEKKYTTLWIQGNHENYDMIAEYPVEEWHGGKVRHIVRDKIILLERGQVFEIEGKTFFTFGGASSHDIQGGVLDRDDIDFDDDRRKAIKSGLPFRIKHESWWEQELPNEDELEEGRKNLTGVGNFFIHLTDDNRRVLLTLVMLDSNMYGEGGWFYSGFDCIHDDQVHWCMEHLQELKKEYPDGKAMAFFHMPLREFREAYEKMKLGDKSVIYQHGSIGEKNEHFGISKYKSTFFNEAVKNGVIKWMFCGHDHLNTLSLIYKGIQMTYGMSIDYLGYKGIRKSYIQRGGTLITRKMDGSVDIRMVPLTDVVSKKIRGVKEI